MFRPPNPIRIAVLAAALCVPAAAALAERPDGTVPDKRKKAPPAKAASGSWSLACGDFAAGKPNPCRLFFAIYLRKTRQLLLSVSVLMRGKTPAPVALFQTPFGTYLPAGVSYKIDGAKPITVAYRTCNAQGCFATAPLSDTQLKRLRSGKILSFTMQDFSRRDIRINLPLTGFDPAYRKMVAK